MERNLDIDVPHRRAEITVEEGDAGEFVMHVQKIRVERGGFVEVFCGASHVVVIHILSIEVSFAYLKGFFSRWREGEGCVFIPIFRWRSNAYEIQTGEYYNDDDDTRADNDHIPRSDA